MHLNKFHHPYNFVAPDAVAGDGRLRFGGRRVRLDCTDCGDEVFRCEVDGPGWRRSHSLAGLTPPRGGGSRSSLGLERGALVLRGRDGEELLASPRGRPLMVHGDGWLLPFVPQEGLRFFGMGEKNLGWEKRVLRTKFWNVDVWGDFNMAVVREAANDPTYVSIPYLAVKRGDTWIGLLVENPDAVFMGLPNPAERADDCFFRAAEPTFYLGSPFGKPVVWMIVGASLAELTRKLQRLCGPTPLPPLWALGHQQCRWGYREAKDLRALARGFRRHGIPDDGLWLDIDYMDRFEVFTWDPKLWRDPAAEIRAVGHPVVPILDPGVKIAPGYHAYESGLRAGIFCQTAEGRPYTGFVWPGPTHFPDFIIPAGRRWWSAQVARWARASGVAGAWLDMNDPAVGTAELDPMRFDRGRLPHHVHHNQYALGMAMASRAGFLAAFPDRRPFLLTRSASTGVSRYSAVWTGDNCANWKHLQGSIAVSLGLAISGVPFNGPDVPGFGGDPGPELAVAWYKAGFLFPFFRNHSDMWAKPKEPWAFGAAAREEIARCIRLRYKLLPYIYNLWIDQEERGEAVMRPLCYDDADGPGQDLAAVGDQFLCGPALLHAPVLHPETDRRRVVLPPGWWFGLHDGRWVRGGRTVVARQGRRGTPLYVRDGSLVAMRPGMPERSGGDLAEVELHAFIRPGGSAAAVYRWDDGATFAYRRGGRSQVAVEVALRGQVAQCRLHPGVLGAGGGTLRLVVHAPVRRMQVLRPDGGVRDVPMRRGREALLGHPLAVSRAPAVRIG